MAAGKSLAPVNKRAVSNDEVNGLRHGDMPSPKDLHDLFTTIGTHGIDVLGDQPKLRSLVLEGGVR